MFRMKKIYTVQLYYFGMKNVLIYIQSKKTKYRHTVLLRSISVKLN